jgi:hypothetical protein
MNTKSIPVENQSSPDEDYSQDSYDESVQEIFDEVDQESENDLN